MNGLSFLAKIMTGQNQVTVKSYEKYTKHYNI